MSRAPTGTLRPSTPLTDDLDLEATLAEVPRSYMVKGMFLARFVGELGSTWPEIERKLVAPPKWGRYLPFSDYPMVDQARLSFMTAKKRWPKVAFEEAVRRLARDDMGVLLGSTFGRISAAVLDGPRAALLAVPTVYDQTVKGCRYEAHALGERHVRLELHQLRGAWGYQVGQLEGVVGHWKVVPSIRCAEPDATTRRFDVTW